MATTGNNAIHTHDIMSSEDDRPRRAYIYSDVTDLTTLPGHEKAVRHKIWSKFHGLTQIFNNNFKTVKDNPNLKKT